MRRPLVSLASLVLLFPLWAGCLSSPAPIPNPTIDLATVNAPGATLEAVEEGIRVVWNGPLKLDHPMRVTIPSGVTRVDATLARADDTAFALALYNEATGRIRCQPDRMDAWFTPMKRLHRCSGITVLDPLPVTWRASTGLLSLEAGQSLELLLSTAPLDGQAGQLRLDQLAMPRYAERPTEALTIPASSDGVPLHVEVTRPAVDGPVPTILVSSPYYQAQRLAGLRAENSTIADWVPRGYAVVTADVRGFGLSGGCVEVWGPKEQQDQVDLVEWIARQPWSSGKVGFYGQSYVGTTPVEAASLAAPHLTTIITIAPVINAYEDWHFGGVPNGESSGSPQAYQTSDGLQRANAVPEDPSLPSILAAADQLGRGLCDPTLAARANDPRAVYDQFYRERDFKAKAKDVQASVFYTQGFYDENVKSQMVPDWFDALGVPKKALFGDWIHQHPPRADQELLFHAWFDHWLMGLDTGIMETPAVEVRTNVDTIRTADTWPPTDASSLSLGLSLEDSTLLAAADGAGSSEYVAQPAPVSSPSSSAAPAPAALLLESEPMAERLYLSGQIELALRATVRGAENTFFYAGLTDVAPDGSLKLVSFGMLNAALRNGYDRYEPLAPLPTEFKVPFLVTEYVVQEGHKLRLELRAADVADWYQVQPTEPALVTVEGPGSTLVLPILAEPGDVPAPDSAGPAPLSA